MFALILKLHEKHFYHLDGSKPVIDCLKIKLFRNHCVSCFKLNCQTVYTYVRCKQRKKHREKSK